MNVNQFPSIEQMTSQIGKVNNNTNTLQQNQNNIIPYLSMHLFKIEYSSASILTIYIVVYISNEKFYMKGIIP